MIEHLFSGTGPVVLAVLWLLIGCSAAAWGITFYKLGQIRRARKQSERFVEVFWDSNSLSNINTASLEFKQSPVAQVFRAGYQELVRLTRGKRGDDESETELGGSANVERAMRRATNQEVTKLERALTFLATIASTAPFIGLFGTVWGIMNAFININQQQQTNLAVVAPGIAEALFATALGLVAAIPAVIFYNKFTGDLDRFGDRLETFSDEVAARLSRRLNERA